MQPLLTDAQQESELMLIQGPTTQWLQKMEGLPEENCEKKLAAQQLFDPGTRLESENVSEGATELPICGCQKGCPTFGWLMKLKSTVVIALWLPHPFLQCQKWSCRMQPHNLNRVREFKATPWLRKSDFFLAFQCSRRKARIGKIFWPIVTQQNCKSQKVCIKPVSWHAHMQYERTQEVVTGSLTNSTGTALYTSLVLPQCHAVAVNMHSEAGGKTI